ncbi:MAG: FecR domain-containing protein [Deltaproteobacteria bacterium]|nr:FecR domain-containing protein [Deltaproteobacteria bacterium]
MSDELIDELGRIAHRDSPPPLALDDLDRMIGAALDATEDEAPQAPPAKRRRGWWIAAAAAVLLAVGGGYLLGGHNAKQPPLQARLASGDVLVASPGAHFEVLEQGPLVRRLELSEGLVLFDVEPLGDEGRFEVVTPDGVVRVRGTVFSVEAGEETVVRVYEGRVEVERGGSVVTLGESQMWRRGETVAWDAGPLADEAATAVAARVEERARVASAAERRTAVGDPRPESESAVGGRLPESDVGGRLAESDVGDRLAESESDVGDRLAESESSVAVASTTEPASPRPRPVRVERDDVQRWLAAGDYERARSTAAARGWTQLEADALRALGRYADAADRYDEVAQNGNGTAAFEAAQLRFQRLSDPSGALASLQAAPAPAALDERRLGLEARLLVRLGRSTEARAIAERYLEAHPQGGLARWMTELRDGAE